MNAVISLFNRLALEPTPLSFTLFSVAVSAFFQVYSWLSLILLELLPLERIEPGGRLRHKRDFTDFACESSLPVE